MVRSDEANLKYLNGVRIEQRSFCSRDDSGQRSHAITTRSPRTHPLPPLDSSAMVVCALLGTLLVMSQPVSAFVAPALWRPTKASIAWPRTSGSSQSRARTSVRIRSSSTSMMSKQPAGGDGSNPRPLPEDPAELAVSVVVVPFKVKSLQLYRTTVNQALL